MYLKKDNVPSLTEFHRIVTTISHEDKIKYLFTVAIKIQDINKKTLLFNELYPPIFAKNKMIDPYERSALQLLSIAVRNEKNNKLNSFSYNSKTHSTLKENFFFFYMLKSFSF